MTSPTSPASLSTAPAGFRPFLDEVCARAGKAGVFGQVAVKDDAPGGSPRLVAAALASAAPAAYRLEWVHGRVWVSLVTSDRWLSQSIEQDLVHTGDKLEDLLDEELTDLAPGFPAAAASRERPIFEHFRSEDLLFTFRSPLPIDPAQPLDTPAAADTAALWLLGYEATFRRLGDMEAGEDDE